MNTKIPEHVSGFLVFTGSQWGIESERGVPVQQNGSRERGQAEKNFDENFSSA